MRVRSYGTGADNRLVHGDNLTALAALRSDFAETIQCAYLDPPFNTGRTFEQYKDALATEDWLAMMRPRLEALVPLLRQDGSVFVEIDDTQLFALGTLMDDVFGAANRVSTITIVRSAPTGHKAINRGPVNVSDFLFCYAKEKKRVRLNALTTIRAGIDRAYSTWLDNPLFAPEKWTFRPLRFVAAQQLGFPTTRAAGVARTDFDSEVERFALAHAEHVIRFAQPRYEAIGRAAQRVVDRSKASPEAVLVHEREGRLPFIVRGGNRILFLKDKVKKIDGRDVMVAPLTNVWTDVPFQGMAREGGVVFSRNKKPEGLVARVLAMATAPGDWVLDPFLGSGTTAAVAHKMGRKWVGIEAGAHLETLAEPRLRRVVDGTDETGISQTTGFAGGGGFSTHRLTGLPIVEPGISPGRRAH